VIVDRVDPQPEREVPRTVEQAPCDVVLEVTASPRGSFYPRDAMLARVFATATCPSVRLSGLWTSVCYTPVLCLAERKQDREMYTV